MAVGQSRHYFQINESELIVATAALRGGWKRPEADALREGRACQDEGGQDNRIGTTNEAKHLVIIQLDCCTCCSGSVMKTVKMHGVVIVSFVIVAHAAGSERAEVLVIAVAPRGRRPSKLCTTLACCSGHPPGPRRNAPRPAPEDAIVLFLARALAF